MYRLKKVLLVMVIISLLGMIHLLGTGLARAQFAGGDGTLGNPFQIATADQLNEVRNHLDKNFVLTANINLDVAPYNSGSGWEFIGSSATPFAGRFNGNGQTISNLYINRPTTYPVGLFGEISGEISNLGIEGGSVSGRYYVGGLLGYNRGGIAIAQSAFMPPARNQVVWWVIIMAEL